MNTENARLKFRVGQRVRLSAEGERIRAARRRFATVVGFGRGTQYEIVRVRWDGKKNSEAFHMDLWEPVE